MNVLSCQWVSLPEKVRVGDLLGLKCEGERSKNFRKPKKRAASLKIKTSQRKKISISFITGLRF